MDSIIMEQFSELRKDHLEVVKSLSEMTAEIRNLTSEIKYLREVDQTIHDRIDKKDTRIRDLETRANVDENRITALETSNRNNRIWIGTSISVFILVATVLLIFF